MKVIHITPTYFDDSSVIGGGERYPTQLAIWMAKYTETKLVSFSSQRSSYRQDDLAVEIYPVKRFIHGDQLNPLNFRYLSTVISADIVHIHNLNTLISDLGCLTASLLGKQVFVTDYGGGGGLVLNRKLPIFKGYRNIIAYSRFGLNLVSGELQDKAVLIKGGIDTDTFCPDPVLDKQKQILYVGRIKPHKGIDYLIKAFRQLNEADYRLRIVGRVYNETFYQDLQHLADGLAVEFIHDADDRQLLQEYRQARVTVLPSVHTDCYGQYSPVPELMGFTLLESQACGTPVICTDAGAMHEFVEQDRTGLIVEQNSPEAIATALKHMINLSPSAYRAYQEHCRDWAQTLSWSTVVQQHLALYQGKLLNGLSGSGY